MTCPRSRRAIEENGSVDRFSRLPILHRLSNLWDRLKTNVSNGPLAIAVASLLWLLIRSGPQPRRLVYPCQRAAAASLSSMLPFLLPALLLAGRRRIAGSMRLIHRRRRLLLASLLFVSILIGPEGYQDGIAQLEASLTGAPPPKIVPPPATVAVVHQERSGELYTAEEIDHMVRRAVELAGGLDPIMIDEDADGQIVVVLKPNLVVDISYTEYPENGIVTDRRVVASVVDLVKEAAARLGVATRIVIAEGSAAPLDGMYTGRDITRFAFAAAGYDSDWDQRFDLDPDVALVDLNDCGGIDPDPPLGCTLVTINDAVMRRQYWAHDVLLEAEVLISIPTLKNHGNADITLALKNRVGTAPSDIYHSRSANPDMANRANQMKYSLHFSLYGFPWDVDRSSGRDYPEETFNPDLIINYTIVDLNLVRPQDFAIIDGLVGITDGPGGFNQPSPNTQLIIAGRDSVAVDSVGTLIMGYNPDAIHHIQWAYNRQLGTMDRAHITITGDPVQEVRTPFGFTTPPSGTALEAETTPPWINGLSLRPGQVVNGDVPITVSDFGDNEGVVRAEITVDGELVATVPHPSDPLTHSWDSTTVEPGWHELTVTVFDAMLNEQSLSVQIYSNPAPHLPGGRAGS